MSKEQPKPAKSSCYVGPLNNNIPVFDVYDYRIYIQVQLASTNRPAYYARLMTKEPEKNFVVPMVQPKLVLSDKPTYYKNLGDLITALKRNPCPNSRLLKPS